MNTWPGATSALAAHEQDNEQVRRAGQLMGIGPIGASAAIATVGDFKQFKSGAQFGAWLGLTPKQHSSGGKSCLGTITKRGDTYLRTLLIQGAKSVVNTAHTRSDPISRWALALKERSGWQTAVVALGQQERPHPVGRHDPRREVQSEPHQRQAGRHPRAGLSAHPLPCTTTRRRCTDRSDRQQASSTNRWWLPGPSPQST